MFQTQLLPTNFARKLADNAGLSDTEVDDVDQRLVNFQQMAISSSFDESLIAYYGTDLTDLQKDVLQTIYNSTVPWIKGHVAGVLMSRLTESKLSIRAAEMVMDIVSEDGPLSNDKLNSILIDLEL